MAEALVGWRSEERLRPAAIGVAQTGYREILAVSEGAKEDKASWTQFLRELKERGLKGVAVDLSATSVWVLVENLAEFYPEAKWQRCVVHFYRNVWTAVSVGQGERCGGDAKGHPCSGRCASRQRKSPAR